MPPDELFSAPIDFSFAKPVAERTEPLFWICEIRFLRKFSSSSEDEIRRIEFRKGLNIIWAEAPTDSSPDDGQRIAGHATGKTTLCRMIRYLLGEPHIASKNVAIAISQQFPDGYVVGRFIVDGESWCVARSFMKIRDDFAKKIDSIDDFLKDNNTKGSFTQFEQRLSELLPKITPLETLANREKLTFKHLLPWFTRDQDSQYTKLTEWRDNTLSDSGSPALSVKQAMLIMRSILEPKVTQEIELISLQTELTKQLQENKDRLNTLESMLAYDSMRIHKIGEKADSATELDEMYLAELHARYEKLLVSACLDNMDNEKLSDLQTKRDELFGQYHSQAAQYNESLQAYRQHVREIKELEKKEKADSFAEEYLDEIQMAAQMQPTRQYCCAPLAVAIKEGCQIALQNIRPIDTASLNNLSSAVSLELQRKRDIANEFANFLKQEKTRLDGLKSAWETSEINLAEFKQKINKEKNLRAARIGNILEAVKRYEYDLNEKEAAKSEYEAIQYQHKQCTEKLALLRETEKQARLEVRNIYDNIIRYILGAEVSGDISFSGGDIELKCSYNNAALSSAALNAAKNICFDLTVMTAAIGGVGSHPRFLMHDGPRVSDLAAAIFRYYFSFARELELLANNKPNFQYIITTTEAPPQELQIYPWLVCKLDAANAESRLLKCNL